MLRRQIKKTEKLFGQNYFESAEDESVTSDDTQDGYGLHDEIEDDGEIDAELEELGDTLELGETDELIEEDGEIDCEILDEGETLALGETDNDEDEEGLTEADGLTDCEIEELGEMLELGETDREE